MSSRADRLVDAVGEQGLDALLITNLPNLRWATGFTGTNGAAVIGPAIRLFLTDFRYVEQAAEQVPDYERRRAGRDLIGDVAERLSGRVGFEDQHLSVRTHGRLVERVGERAELVGAQRRGLPIRPMPSSPRPGSPAAPRSRSPRHSRCGCASWARRIARFRR